MIKVYYAKVDVEWNKDELREKTGCLPPLMVEEAMKYRNWVDKQLSVGGKLLLLTSLKDFNLSRQLQLRDLVYNEYEKPYFNNAFNFNISHAKNMVVCASTTAGKIGIDIEKIQPIQIDYLNEYFTVAEIEAINKSDDINRAFYNVWTKKEAFIKAIGKGLTIELAEIDTITNKIVYGTASYYLHNVAIKDGYDCYVCSTEKEAQITTVEVVL